MNSFIYVLFAHEAAAEAPTDPTWLVCPNLSKLLTCFLTSLPPFRLSTLRDSEYPSVSKLVSISCHAHSASLIIAGCSYNIENLSFVYGIISLYALLFSCIIYVLNRFRRQFEFSRVSFRSKRSISNIARITLTAPGIYSWGGRSSCLRECFENIQTFYVTKIGHDLAQGTDEY